MMGHIANEAHLMQRHDRAVNWKEKAPILFVGEIGCEIDTGRFKLGDGLKTWNELSYAADPTGSAPALGTRLTEHMGDTVSHATQAEKDGWNGKAAGDHNHDGVYELAGAAENKMDRVPTAAAGNLAVFDESGNVQDCGAAPENLESIRQELAELKQDLETKVTANEDGIAPDAEKLGGVAADEYAKKSEVSAQMLEKAHGNAQTGAALNAEKLGGKAYASLFDGAGKALDAVKLSGVAASSYALTESGRWTIGAYGSENLKRATLLNVFIPTYEKIGRFVTVSFNIYIQPSAGSSWNGATGIATFDGLPFAARAYCSAKTPAVVGIAEGARLSNVIAHISGTKITFSFGSPESDVKISDVTERYSAFQATITYLTD